VTRVQPRGPAPDDLVAPPDLVAARQPANPGRDDGVDDRPSGPSADPGAGRERPALPGVQPDRDRQAGGREARPPPGVHPRLGVGGADEVGQQAR
jgi:hypothetical protein